MFYYYLYDFIIESDFKIKACECEMYKYSKLQNINNVIKYRKLTYTKKKEIYECTNWSYLTLKYYPLIAYETNKYIILRYLDLYFVAISRSAKEIFVDIDSVDSKMSINVALGGALSICMYTVGYLPIHASSVDYNNNPIVFIAPSKTGKSTLQHYMLKSGCKSITDDVLPIKIYNEEILCYSSKNLKIKIDKFLANRLNISVEESNIVTDLENKYWMSLNPDVRSHKNYKLKYMFLLDPSTYCRDVTIQKISKIEKFHTVIANCHFIQFTPDESRNEIIHNIVNIFKYIDIYKISYEKKYNIIPQVIKEVFDFVSD